MSAKHTPGPWRQRDRTASSPNGIAIIGADGVIVARLPYKADKSNLQKYADGRLIAAAPDLLEALRNLIGWIPNAETLARLGFVTEGPQTAHAKARAAIAKATGEQS